MTAQPLTIAPTAGFREAVRLFPQPGVDALPVVDGERLVGLVGAEDLLLKEEMVELSHGGSGLPWQRHRDRVRAKGRPVSDVMDAQPPTVKPDTTLGRAAASCTAGTVGACPSSTATASSSALSPGPTCSTSTCATTASWSGTSSRCCRPTGGTCTPACGTAA